MGDVPFPPEPEPTRVDEAKEAVRSAVYTTNRTVRTALTGDPQGRIRRTVLFVIAGVALGATLSPIAIVGMIAVLLLALTDAVAEPA